MDNFTKFTWSTLGVLSIIFIGMILCILWALPTYLLWNWIMPIFGLPTLSIWETFGLIFLCKFLFQQPNYNVVKEMVKEKI
tara:strand:+ start:67 stop:309 length:243 start_codon:yes stop_codon:yes gene_type:complete